MKMDYSVEIDKEKQYMLVVGSGTMKYECTTKIMTEYLNIIRENSIKYSLYDYSKVNIMMEKKELIYLTKIFAKRFSFPEDLKRAIVTDLGSAPIYETASQLKNINVRIFTDKESALEWLFNDEVNTKTQISNKSKPLNL